MFSLLFCILPVSQTILKLGGYCVLTHLLFSPGQAIFPPLTCFGVARCKQAEGHSSTHDASPKHAAAAAPAVARAPTKQTPPRGRRGEGPRRAAIPRFKSVCRSRRKQPSSTPKKEVHKQHQPAGQDIALPAHSNSERSWLAGTIQIF